MISVRTSMHVAALVLGLLAMVLVGCGGGGGGGSTGTLQVSLVDAPLNADEINVSITSIEVHKSGGGWVTLKTFDPALEVNLLEYSSSGPGLLLATEPLGAGHYTMVRLMLSSAEVVIDGTPHAVDLTNITSTGVKCNGQFEVTSGQLMALKLDFNAHKSFVESPPNSGNFSLHPVMSMSPVNVAAEVTGTVAFLDAGSNPLPVPDLTEVNVYPAGQCGVAEALISGAPVSMVDGTFLISVLPAGVYDFEVTVAGVSVKQVLGQTLVPGTNSLGTITVTDAAPPPPPPGP